MNEVCEKDAFYMQQAFVLAKRGEFSARPNPCVGCLLVNRDQVIAKGWHWQAGSDHAEIMALKQAGSVAKGATCYVTLEPCCHQGLTGPCVTALIEAGVKRVVIAHTDQNPLVRGKGIKHLQQQGIEVTENVLSRVAKPFYQGFFSRMERNRPFVRAKVAMSVDGRIALPNNQSKWISSGLSRQEGHRWRARSGAIISTAQTVRLDESRLTVRDLPELSELPKEVAFQPPLRVILDQRLTLPPQAALFQERSKIVLIVSEKTAQEKAAQIAAYANHVDFVSVPLQGKHLCLESVLSWLAVQKMNEVLVEAGSQLVGALLEQNLLDEMLIYMAPSLFGKDALALSNIAGIESMEQKISGTFINVETIDRDIFIQMAISEYARKAYDYPSN